MHSRGRAQAEHRHSGGTALTSDASPQHSIVYLKHSHREIANEFKLKSVLRITELNKDYGYYMISLSVVHT